MDHIPVFKPLIEDEEIDAAVLSLRQGWLGMGASVGEFERALKSYLGCQDRHVVALSTGHAALHLAMMIIGLKPGDEVITPSFNNIADFQAIMAVGASPVLCDIREDTLCIDVEKASRLITPRTKAIIAMDYDCFLADHDAVSALANRHGLRIVHDAAHSLGSYYKGRMVGTFSDLCMFSFDPVKTVTCIDGGALVVRSQEELEALHEMRLVGMGQPASVMYQNKRAWTYDVKQLGFRYHLTNLHASIGLSQLSKMDRITKVRQDACRLYAKLLSEVAEVKAPDTDFSSVTPFLYYIRVPETRRSALQEYLHARGIDTGIHWQPGHWFTFLKNSRRGDLEVTERVGKTVLSLPLSSQITEDQVTRIVLAIKQFFSET